MSEDIAIAAKYGHKFKDNIALSLSIGLDSAGNSAYGAGFDFGF